MSDAPKVSVIIPAYNRAAELPRAVASVQAQDFPDMEILIVDDGSADNTADVVRDLMQTDRRIRYLPHPHNKGEAAARNTGLFAARGDYIAYLDSDDAWIEGKLRRQYDVLRAAGATGDAVVTGNIIVWPDGREVFEDDAWHFHHPITVRNMLVNGCPIGLGNMLIRRELALEAGAFDETLRFYVDSDWFCRFLDRANIIALPEPYTLYHKAPFRRGDVMEAAIFAYMAKIAPLAARLSWRDRGRMRAVLWRSVALSYRAEGRRCHLVRASFWALFYDPFVSVGNYIDLIDVAFGTRIVEWVRNRRSRYERTLKSGEAK